MDVDEAQVEFEVTPIPEELAHHALATLFSPFPFTIEKRDAIFARRSVMADELVFDLLLEQASIASPQSLYPPYSAESLAVLLHAIANCPWDTLKKACLQFYLLSHVSADVAAQHAADCALPPQFVHLAQACFLLDSGTSEDLARAVALLSDARIVQDLSPKILQTLSLAPPAVSSRLVRSYVRTAKPVLEDYEDLAIYLRALIEYSLADAWSFQRTFSETTPTRNQLIRTVLDSCLVPPKPALLPQLLSLPLTSFEFSLLQSYALAPPEELSPAAHAILQSLITVRLLHSGKYSDAVRISRAFDTFNAKSRSAAPTLLHKAAEERQQMMRDILAVVPEVQRRQLELELDDEARGPYTTSPSASWVIEGNDISMSWESLGVSTSAKSREKGMGRTRADRLEGSPAPAVPGRSNAGTPFGPFTSTGSKRKVSASASDLAKSTPTRALARPQMAISALPTQPSGTPPTLARFSLGTSPGMGLSPLSHLTQGLQAGSRPGLNFAARLNAPNVHHELESARTLPSLFAQRQQDITNTPFSTPNNNASGEKTTPETRTGKISTDEAPQVNKNREQDDIVMLDSDDPDAFVVRGRRRPPLYSAVRNGAPNITSDENQDKVNERVSLSRRDVPITQKSDDEQQKNDTRVLPGGLTMEPAEGDRGPSSLGAMTNELASVEHQRSRPPPLFGKSDAQRHSSPTSPRFKIPGALFEEDAEEDQDRVPSLPPALMKGGRRKRTNRANDSVESEDEHSRTPLRRSSRLSSAGPSPESSPAKKGGKKIVSKRSTKANVGGTARRKGKSMDG